MRTLKQYGYIVIRKIAETLQGFIIEAKDEYTNKKYIVKMSEIELYSKNKTKRGDDVQENILKEMELMKYLQKRNPSDSFLKIINSFKDKKYLYIIMDHGGESFFDYVVKNHKNIIKNKLSIYEWQKHLRILFKQIINLLNWLHNSCYVCHLDISLENMVIRDVKFDNKSKKFIKHGILSLCDYGLSEKFIKDNFYSSKYAGKIGYCDPLIPQHKIYDARKADIYSLSICMFNAYIGAPPYMEPTKDDRGFKLLFYKHKINVLLDHWGKLKYMPKEISNILKKIWVNQYERIFITDLVFNEYFYECNNSSTSSCFVIDNKRYSFSDTKRSSISRSLLSPSLTEISIDNDDDIFNDSNNKFNSILDVNKSIYIENN